MHAAIVLLVLILTYAGMVAGRIPRLQVDRTGIALLAVIALLVSGQMTLDDFGTNIDVPTLTLLFAMMIISAQFAESGFIDLCARTFTSTRHGTTVLLALTVAIGGALSAVLANDILIVTIAPPLIVGARKRGCDPRPFAIALAAATNAGSAATLIGNPQNILVGEIGRLGFSKFFLVCIVPSLFALLTVFVVVWLQWRRRIFIGEAADPPDLPPVVSHPFDRNQVIKGAVALVALLALFLTSLPRELGALFIAALLLANRKITSRTMMAAVDWPLLLLVACLFAITGELRTALLNDEVSVAAHINEFLGQYAILPNGLIPLTVFSVVGSNAIGSLPSSMLLLQVWPAPPAGVLYSLALLSTLAGNLLLSGSLTNILIAERADRMGAHINFVDYAKTGVPIALISLAFAFFWLAVTHRLPLLPTPLTGD